MGTGARYERAALGQALGESKGIQAHELAMIPIVEKQFESELEMERKKAEAELEMGKKLFEQQVEQTKELYLLANRLEGQSQEYMPIVTPGLDPGGEIGTGTKPMSNYLIIGMVLLAWFFLKGK